MDIPMPHLGANMETIITYAVRWLNSLDDQRILWVIAAMSLAMSAILWVIKTVQNPPSLDI